MKKFGKSAFVLAVTLVSYAGFVSAQVVSFDTAGGNAGDLKALVDNMKFGGGPGGHGGPGDHNGPGPQPGPGGHGDHNGPGPQPGPWHPQPGPQPGPWNPQPGPHPDPWHPGPQPGPWHPGPQPGPWHPGPQPDPWHPGPQPGPWHPQPGPQPGPWHPGPQPGQWHPHHNGHPDWDHNDWNHNGWQHPDPAYNDWWNNYNAWWANYNHPYSQFHTVCTVIPGSSAKGFIIDQTMPFNGTASFYYYDAFENMVAVSNPVNGVYRGGDGTPVFDFYNIPSQADHCFFSVVQH